MSNNTRVAVLIDADNVAPHHAESIMKLARSHGMVGAARAYGNFICQQTWPQSAQSHGIQSIHHKPAINGKNGVDIAMTIDAIDLLHTGAYDLFIVATSDADFVPLAFRIRSAGLSFIGVGKPETNEAYRAACSEYHALESAKVKAAQQNSKITQNVSAKSVALSLPKPVLTENKVVTATAADFDALANECAAICVTHGGSLALHRLEAVLVHHGVWPNRPLFGSTKLAKVVEDSGLFHCDGCGPLAQITLKGRAEEVAPSSVELDMEPTFGAPLSLPEAETEQLVRESVAVCRTLGDAADLVAIGCALTKAGIWPNKAVFRNTKLRTVLESSERFLFRPKGTLVYVSLLDDGDEPVTETPATHLAPSQDSAETDPVSARFALVEKIVEICQVSGGAATLAAIGSQLASVGLWPKMALFGKTKLGGIIVSAGRFTVSGCGPEALISVRDTVATDQVEIAEKACLDPRDQMRDTLVDMLDGAPERSLPLSAIGIKLKASYPGFACSQFGARTLQEMIELLLDEVVFDGNGGNKRVILPQDRSLAA